MGEQLEDPLTASTVLDPGWIPAFAEMLPWFGLLVVRRAEPFTKLRGIFLAFYLSVALFGLFLITVEQPQSTSGPSPTACVGIVGTVGAIALIVEVMLRTPPLTGTSTRDLFTKYQRSFFLLVACAEVPPLIGFVFAIYTNRPWLYFVGAGIAAIGLTLAAPTHHDIYRHDAALLRPFLRRPDPRPIQT